MTFQRAVSSKAQSAYITFEEFFTSMSAKMTFQRAVFSKAQSTHITFEGFFHKYECENDFVKCRFQQNTIHTYHMDRQTPHIQIAVFD